MPKGRATKTCRQCGVSYYGATAGFICSPKCRILANVHVDSQRGCWLWQKSLVHGYGRTSIGRRQVTTHRLSYITFKGPIPAGLSVCHACDTPRCCNPEHLFLGTTTDNLHDAMRKRRLRNGEGINTAKLTADDVRAIRADTRMQKDIAASYGVGAAQIRAIQKRRSWRYVE